MMLARSTNIRSGWWRIFQVLGDAAKDSAEKVVRLSYETTQQVLSSYFTLIRENFLDCFRCVCDFAMNSASTEIRCAE